MADKQNIRVKLRVPDGCRAITIDGVAVPIAADGSLETDGATAAALEAHGAEPWRDEPQAAEIATMPRDALVELFMARTRAALNAQDTDTIRASLSDGDEEPASPSVTRDDIAGMNRAAVTAFLRDRRCEAPSSASLAELRQRAVDALGA